ncbi:hypothetical protein SAMN05421738_1077 [Algoriella xinjiangensis]|uniref:Lipoprotein n=1 Tax=Algoriella xinjiangensis TaxID=684065 RepID=A0A1I4WGL9_9FLAO|nr:hypothetical protein [Algoriella xinjiangensis]SFN12994.1 hypothetical protein SAMN05421738_1077 [Algoriella xinjiangensis]VDH16924.1 Uncharacterised protein [Algoriella xinjiangensis]
MKNYLLYTFTLITFLFSCQSKKENSNVDTKNEIVWTDVKVVPYLNKNEIYDRMIHEPEILDIQDEKDTTAKRSVIIDFYTSDSEDFSKSYKDTIFNCKANLHHPDSLTITIEYRNLVSADGLLIDVNKEKFTTKPFYHADVSKNKEKVKSIVLKQELRLNKANYKVGDSIFGRLYFYTMNISNKQDTTYFRGKGTFMTKIK